MPLGDIYRKDPPFVISYNFADLVSQTGYVTYYLKTVNGNSTEFAYTTDSSSKSDRSHTTTADGTAVQNVNTKMHEQDIDLEFNVAHRIKGDILVEIPAGFQDTTSQSGTINIKVSAYHYDGATETQIGSTVESASHIISGATTDGSMFACKINASSSIQFAIGDKLRLTVEVWLNLSSAAGVINYTGICHDPADRDDFSRDSVSTDKPILQAGDSTRFKLDVPFDLDI